MRKELSKRRRLNSGSDDVQTLLKEAKSLTVKQRETITNQLASEAMVREKMTALDHKLETAELVMKMVCCYRESISLLPLLVTSMLSCMTSGLAGGRVINMWSMMSDSVLANKKNGNPLVLGNAKCLSFHHSCPLSHCQHTSAGALLLSFL